MGNTLSGAQRREFEVLRRNSKGVVDIITYVEPSRATAGGAGSTAHRRQRSFIRRKSNGCPQSEAAARLDDTGPQMVPAILVLTPHSSTLTTLRISSVLNPNAIGVCTPGSGITS
jgi:hypothetical protein